MPAAKAVMATWDVEDLTKELKDMELIAMRNKSSELHSKNADCLEGQSGWHPDDHTLQLCEAFHCFGRKHLANGNEKGTCNLP